MKWLNLFTVFLFGSFVFVQHNDPDFLKWMIIYLPMVVLPLLIIFNRTYVNAFLFYSIAVLAYSISYLPDYAQWNRDGRPSIIELDSPNVESMREFFGLLICLIFALAYWRVTRKKRSEA